jgi:hypothetical protein
MALAIHQKILTGATSVSGSTCLGAFGSNTVTGNNIIVTSFNPNPASSNITVSSIAISAGSATFTKVVAVAANQNGGTATGTEIWQAHNITGGTTPTITITYSSTATGSEFEAYEVSGADSGGATDGTATASPSAGSTTLSCGPITTTNANDLLIAGFSCGATGNGSETGWTVDLTAGGNVAQYIIESATGTYTATNAQSSAAVYTGVFATFKAASGGTVNMGTVAMQFKVGLSPAPKVIALLKDTMQFKVGITTAKASALLKSTMQFALGITVAKVVALLNAAIQTKIGITPGPTLGLGAVNVPMQFKLGITNAKLSALLKSTMTFNAGITNAKVSVRMASAMSFLVGITNPSLKLSLGTVPMQFKVGLVNAKASVNMSDPMTFRVGFSPAPVLHGGGAQTLVIYYFLDGTGLHRAVAENPATGD